MREWRLYLCTRPSTSPIVFFVGNGTPFYMIDVETFDTNKKLNSIFNYLWAFLGYFIPVAVLAFCNVWLILALRESRVLRETAARVSSRSAGYSSARRSSNRITFTLIALVVMFIVLVSPSEIVQFYVHVQPEALNALQIAITVANLLQTINFALTFVLYCAVNVTFRRAVVSMGYYVVNFCRNSDRRSMHRQESVSHRSTLLPSQLRSHETNI